MPSRTTVFALFALLSTTLGCNAQQPYSPGKAPYASATTPGPHLSQPTSFTPTQSYIIEDTTYGMPYARLAIPAGWGYNGGILHVETCAVTGPSPVYAIASPDGQFGFILAPKLLSWATTDPNVSAMLQQGGCRQYYAKSAADFVQVMLLPRLGLQNMTVQNIGPAPEFATFVQQIRQQQQASAIPDTQVMQQRNSVDTAKITLSFQAHGRPMQAIVSGIVSCQDTRSAAYGMKPIEQHQCEARAISFAYAPAGQLGKIEKGDFVAMQPSTAWEQRRQQEINAVNQGFTNQLVANGKVIQQRQDALIQHGNDLMAAQKRQYQSGMDAAHPSADSLHQTSQAAAAHNGDYNDFYDPATGKTVRASNQFANTYANPNGSVMLQTDQPGSPGVDWSLMIPRF